MMAAIMRTGEGQRRQQFDCVLCSWTKSVQVALGPGRSYRQPYKSIDRRKLADSCQDL